MPARHAAITIVSKNYLSLAYVLADSYKLHHPDHDFIVVLVDRLDGYEYPLPRGAELVEFLDLGMPDPGSFIYRYSIMELNTAVKPYALHRLMEERGYETILYIDPDIKLYAPLSEVYSGLDEADIVLIPHMRQPFHDGAGPSELNILQSGTYNLGFCGLRRSDSVDSLLQWWMRNLFMDCVVNIPIGLFVDQKWMDLVPGYYPRTKILHHPGYNTAYWNLHERNVTIAPDGSFLVDGLPLVFFHFSGYSPLRPDVLSKHQNRHDFKRLPEVAEVFRQYGQDVLAADFETTSKWPYAFSRLPNGIKPPKQMAEMLQGLLRGNVTFPDPIEEADAFCEFLVTPGSIPGGENANPLVHYLFQRRPDVAAHFSQGRTNPFDEELRKWMISRGAKEEDLAEIMAFAANLDQKERPSVKQVFEKLDRYAREDVYGYFFDMWWDETKFDEFVKWVRTYGHDELDFTDEQADAFVEARNGPLKILNLYFMRGDLQREFDVLEQPHTADRFCNWLLSRRTESGIETDEIGLFRKYVERTPDHLCQMRMLYQHYGEPYRNGVTLLNLSRRAREIGATTKLSTLAEWLVDQPEFTAKGLLGNDMPSGGVVSGLPFEGAVDLVAKVSARRASENAEGGFNFAGFLDAKTGVGESSRGNLALLRSALSKVSAYTLPSLTPEGLLRENGLLFGWPNPNAQTTFTVANADAIPQVRNWLPGPFWGKRNIGYWVWETERLPAWQGESAEDFTEIWTASTYSADAIRSAVSIPVHVLPHVVEFEALDRARGDRKRFGLPEGKTLYGFMFDPKSVLERKNVLGLVRAFKEAITRDDNAILILKSSDRIGYSFDYEMLKAEADNERVVFVEKTLDREGTFDFMKSLDVYISLHRAEGFGLTCAEAMAAGIPTIATGYSGNLEFMTPQNSLLVPARTIETDRPFVPYPRGTLWGDPDHDAAVEAIRAMLNGDVREAVGAAGAESVRNQLSVETLTRRVKALLEGTQAAGRMPEAVF